MAKSALIESVKRLDLDATVTLLNARPSLVATRDPQGRNLLHVACCVSPAKLGVPGTAQTRFVKVLLDCGLDADIDAPIGRDACTGLFFAVARARNLPLVRLLLRRGARPELAPGGGLFAAGWWQDLAIMDSLIRAGASIDIVVGVTVNHQQWDARKRHSGLQSVKK